MSRGFEAARAEVHAILDAVATVLTGLGAQRSICRITWREKMALPMTAEPQVVARNERPRSLTLRGKGAATWDKALAPCKLPTVTKKQLEEMREAENYLSYLQDSVPKTAENYQTLLAAFGCALWGLFERHPMGPRFAFDEFIRQTRRWLKECEKHGW